jgi:hypothetical protein
MSKLVCSDCNYHRGVKNTSKGPLCKDCRSIHNVKSNKNDNKVQFKNNKVNDSFINFWGK